jgi:hypothetical protein
MRTPLTLLLAALTIFVGGCGEQATVDKAGATAAKRAATSAAEPDRDLRTITYEGRDGETALDLLRDEGYDVSVKSSSMGDYVTAIGDVEANPKEYWLFEVDGELPNVGADAFETKDGQQVEWRYGS